MMLDHIGVYVKDLEKARTFFIKYLKASSNAKYHNPKTGLQTYFLSFENDARLEIMQRPDIKESIFETHKEGYHHIAFQCSSKKEVDDLTDILENDGYQILNGPRVTGDGYYETIFLYETYAIELIFKQ